MKRPNCTCAHPAWRAIALAIATTVFCLGCSEQRTLTGAEIKALFEGHTVAGHHALFDYTFRSFYAPDGTLRSYQDTSGKPQTGRWWIDNEAMCLRWSDQSADLCRPIVEQNGTYKKVLKPGGKLLVKFTEFRRGNPDNL